MKAQEADILDVMPKIKAMGMSVSMNVLWLNKLNMKLFTSYNYCPIDKIRPEEVQGFALIFD
jgi:hypothetical protein